MPVKPKRTAKSLKEERVAHSPKEILPSILVDDDLGYGTT
jgi:hypothetical protein